MKKMKLDKIKSLTDLRWRAERDSRYLQLAICGAENLGGMASLPDEDAKPGSPTYLFALNSAMRVLQMNANETGSETGVVREVNAVRDCVR